MVLYTKMGCIPCNRIKQVIADHYDGTPIEVFTYDLSVESDWEVWKQLRENLGFTISPVLKDGAEVICGVSAISKYLGVEQWL